MLPRRPRIVSSILENNETTSSRALRSRAGIINSVIDAGLFVDNGRFSGRCATEVERLEEDFFVVVVAVPTVVAVVAVFEAFVAIDDFLDVVDIDLAPSKLLDLLLEEFGSVSPAAERLLLSSKYSPNACSTGVGISGISICVRSVYRMIDITVLIDFNECGDMIAAKFCG